MVHNTLKYKAYGCCWYYASEAVIRWVSGFRLGGWGSNILELSKSLTCTAHLEFCWRSLDKSHAANVLNSKNNSRSMWASRRALLRSTHPHTTSVENSTSQIWTNPKENLFGASHVCGAQIAKGQECWISTGKSNGSGAPIVALILLKRLKVKHFQLCLVYNLDHIDSDDDDRLALSSVLPNASLCLDCGAYEDCTDTICIHQNLLYFYMYWLHWLQSRTCTPCITCTCVDCDTICNQQNLLFFYMYYLHCLQSRACTPCATWTCVDCGAYEDGSDTICNPLIDETR